MKIFNSIFAFLFLLSAIVQYNDPDPFLWIGLYGLGALICLLAIFGKDNFIWHYTGLIIYLSYATYLFFEPMGVLSWILDYQRENIAQEMAAGKPWIENTREFFGLLILSFALMMNLLSLKYRTKPKPAKYKSSR